MTGVMTGFFFYVLGPSQRTARSRLVSEKLQTVCLAEFMEQASRIEPHFNPSVRAVGCQKILLPNVPNEIFSMPPFHSP